MSHHHQQSTHAYVRIHTHAQTHTHASPITQVGFLLSFLISTKVQFALDRYRLGVRAFARLCNGVLQLSHLSYGLIKRESDMCGKERARCIRDMGAVMRKYFFFLLLFVCLFACVCVYIVVI